MHSSGAGVLRGERPGAGERGAFDGLYSFAHCHLSAARGGGAPAVPGRLASLVVGCLAGSVLLCALAGCGAADYRRAGFHTAKGAVGGVVEGLSELPEPALARIAGDGRLRRAARELARSVVAGAGDGIDDGRVGDRTQALVQRLFVVAREQGNDAVARVLDEQGPRLQLAVRQTLARSIHDAGAAFRESAETDLAGATDRLVGAAVRSFVLALSADDAKRLRADAVGLAGELSESAGRGAVRGVARELSTEEARAALADATYRVTEAAVRGVHDGVREDASALAAWAIVEGVLLAITACALALFVRRTRRASLTLAVVAGAINKAERERLDAKRLKAAIGEKARAGGVGVFLDRFLKERGL